MQIRFDSKIADFYKSASQKVRILTESWVANEAYCPNCGISISSYENNRPVADFFCPSCVEDYELKSKKNSIGKKIVDGAYRTMISRLQSNSNPNFFLLSYDLKGYKILNFFVIPKHFFVPEIIERRKPLSPIARRAGWVGCNILLKDIPLTGKIFYVKNGVACDKKNVLKNWKKTLFLREERHSQSRGWILDVMNCIDKLCKKEFSLDEIYVFEKKLAEKHPENCHVPAKIRQQLQILRDRGYIKFIGRGKYELK